MEERKQKEVEFHDTREHLRQSDHEKYEEITRNKKFYVITRRSRLYWEQWLRTHCPGKRFLDYCCGTGSVSMMAASCGADVVGIDISGESIKACQRTATEEGLQDRTAFFAMDAENLEFKDASFDIIFCGGVLHHLDINKAFHELSRVIRPHGEIMCVEALGSNPLINWYRKRTPHMRTKWEMEHILTMKDIDIARKHFQKIDMKFFHLASIAAVPFRRLPIFSPILSLLEWVDEAFLKLPIVQEQAWQIIFKLSEPRGFLNH